MTDDLPNIDQERLVQYIRAALLMDSQPADPKWIERVLTLEMEYLQHMGIAAEAIDAPRPEQA